MCPILEVTVKPLPRYFSMVLAFAGDSTITRFFIFKKITVQQKI
jgi:hypothetical protein